LVGGLTTGGAGEDFVALSRNVAVRTIDETTRAHLASPVRKRSLTLGRIAAVAANPTGAWTAQQARTIVGAFTDRRATPIGLLIRDRDVKFKAAFDDVFQSEDPGSSARRLGRRRRTRSRSISSAPFAATASIGS
jgi:hypothetical protein